MQIFSTLYPTQQHLHTLYTIIPFGLIVFINGFFVFPEVSWVKSSFYLLVLLPSLAIMPLELKKFPFHSKTFLIFIALPFYLCISHLWASERHITRDFFFFIKQVIFLFGLVFSFWIAIRNNKNFLLTLTLSLVVTGTAFSFISIVQHLLTYGGAFTSQPLMGFSTDDANKIAAYHVVHLAFCCYFLLFSSPPHKSVSAHILLGLAIVLDIALIILSESKGPWITVPLIALFFILYKVDLPFKVILLFLTACLSTIAVWYFKPLEMLNDMISYSIRVKLLEESIAQVEGQYLFGLGLTYKLNIPSEIHSHNIFTDTFRFGGIVALFLIISQVLSTFWLQIRDQNRTFAFVIFLWFFIGITLLSLYGQQVLTRPGYIWFLYWIPLSITISNHLSKYGQLAATQKTAA